MAKVMMNFMKVFVRTKIVPTVSLNFRLILNLYKEKVQERGMITKIYFVLSKLYPNYYPETKSLTPQL